MCQALKAWEFRSGKLSKFTRQKRKETEEQEGKDNVRQFFLTLCDQGRLRKLQPVRLIETVGSYFTQVSKI